MAKSLGTYVLDVFGFLDNLKQRCKRIKYNEPQPEFICLLYGYKGCIPTFTKTISTIYQFSIIKGRLIAVNK